MTGESGTARTYTIYATYTEDVASVPSSSVAAITPYWTPLSANPKTITATATDAAGDNNVKNVSLWYRYGTTNSSWGGWTLFSTIQYPTAWSWSFTFTNGSGYYQFYTIAKDVDGNVESAPGSADRICAYDGILPTSSVNALAYTQTTTPITVTATAADTGYSGLKNVSLWSRNSSDNITWGAYTKKSTLTSAPWSWSYPIVNAKYYQFYSIAFDNATNSETGYTRTFGYSSVGSSFVSSGISNMFGSWHQATESFTMTTMSIYTYRQSGTSKNLTGVLYNWVSNSNVGTVLGSTVDTKVTSATPQWYTMNMKTPVSIVAGTKYFLIFYQGNQTGGTSDLNIYRTSATARGMLKESGLSYPTIPSPLTGESGFNYNISIYSSYIVKDQAIYANLIPPRAWATKATGWDTFRNTPGWLTKTNGYDTFGNTAAWVTPQQGYNTFGSISVWLNQTIGYNTFSNQSSYHIIDQGWNTFGNISSWVLIEQGWNTFGNTASWGIIDQGWNNFSNQASYTIIDQGWNIFSNSIAWVTADQGYNTFNNQSQYNTIDQGWNSFKNTYWATIINGYNTFRNASSWVTIEQGWNTFGNASYMAILDIFPSNGSTICPTCYENDTFFYFSITVGHANGTLMDITWTTWNGTVLGAVNNVGNGTYHIVPYESVLPIIYNSSFNYTVNVTDGVTTINQTIIFFTNTQSFCEQFLGGGFTDEEFAIVLLIVCFTLFFVVGYRSKKRSGGAFMLLSGFFLIALAAVINILYAQVFIVPFAVFIIVIGIRKWLFRPEKEKTKTEGE